LFGQSYGDKGIRADEAQMYRQWREVYGAARQEGSMGTKRGRILRGLAAGAVGGLAASWVMNQFQEGVAFAGREFFDDAPPKQKGDDATVKTAGAISKAVRGRKVSRREKKSAASAVHYGFGALCGAVYGVMAETVPASKLGFGTAYGSAVWLLADEIAVPALGLSQPISKTPAGAHAKALASHWVYGLTTELTRRAIMKATD
jgi:putative membrane protein